MEVFSPRVNPSAARRDFPAKVRGVTGAKRGLPRVNSGEALRVRNAAAMRVAHSRNAIRHEVRAAFRAERANNRGELRRALFGGRAGMPENGARAFIDANP